MSQETKPVDLLWTGGWDSTFRMIHLVIKQKRTVQPHYLIDAERRSTPEELLVRDKIRDLLFLRFPEAQDRLCPTKFFDITELPDMPVITKSYERLRQRVAIGTQYDWMARYCAMSGLKNVETCIHTGGMANKLLDPMALLTKSESDHYYALDSHFQGTDEYNVFGHYHFPLYDMHKVDMGKIAQDNGWLDLLDLTWFCQKPMPNHTPCGRCNPCCMVMKERMTRRLPLTSRILYYVTLRNLAHSDSNFYKTARQLKRRILPARVVPHTH